MPGNESTRFEMRFPAPHRVTQVIIGAGILDDVGAMMAQIAPAPRAAVVYDQALPDEHIEPVFASLKSHGLAITQIAIKATEANKQMPQIESLHTRFLLDALERTSPIIAIGGGIIGDITGFAAATYLRGVPFINIPTTLLAMIDASIGGKTGVNARLPRIDQLGKNLVGAFHQPQAVIADVKTLRTLPEQIFSAGLAEAIKHGLLGDVELFDQLESADHTISLESPDDILIDFVKRNMQLKASIVQRDEHETGLRMHLNLGHTYAHAIEAVLPDEFQHGQAVALGLIAAVCAGVAHHVTPDDLPGRIQSVNRRHKLPLTVGTSRPMSEFIGAMRSDKKRHHDRLRLVLPTTIGSCAVFDDLPATTVEAGWQAIGIRN